MTRIDDVSALIEKRLALYEETGTEPNPDLMTEDLLDEGHLLPDLPKPETVGDNFWFDEIEIVPDNTATDHSNDFLREVNSEELRLRAAWLLAAAEHHERNQE